MRRLIPGFLLLTMMLSSCMVVDLIRPKEYETQLDFRGTEINRYAIDGGIAEDSLVMSMIRPYQVELTTRMNRVIGQAESDFSNVRPNGSLGDFAADMLRRTASEHLGFSVDIGLTNWGGLRIPINKGPIRVGDIYSVMPFENTLVVLTFTGAQIRDIANELAASGGQPISGLRMRIEDGKAADVLVGTRAIKDDDTYTIVTSNFLADGGDGYKALQKPVKRQDLNILMRDAMIRYINDRYNVSPTFDSRLR
jgi:2',3'-cyclic-nucleotide 2'-phosphodiesterase (5'-nucleotidase family)